VCAACALWNSAIAGLAGTLASVIVKSHPQPRRSVGTPKYLVSRFHMAMLQIFDDVIEACGGYRPTQFRKLVSEKGGLEAARFLLVGTNPASGFAELLLCKRLDLSMEALVTLEPWCQLFTQEELGQAKKRLADVGFSTFQPKYIDDQIDPDALGSQVVSGAELQQRLD
jgi:hypothetical protein